MQICLREGGPVKTHATSLTACYRHAYEHCDDSQTQVYYYQFTLFTAVLFILAYLLLMPERY